MSNDLITTFAERLRLMRQRRRLTQAQLAHRAQTHNTLIAHYETQQRLPSCENLCRLAEALGTTTDYLLGRTNDWSRDPFISDVDGIVGQYADLSDHSRIIIRRMIEVLKAEAEGR